MTTTNSIPAAVHPLEVSTLLSHGADLILIDVRSPQEFESAHIPGSYNVPLDLLAEHRAELQRIGAPIVLVCRSGNRAQQAERILKAGGLQRLHVMVGGAQGWEAAGLQLIRGQKRWSLERQVRAIAGALVLLGALGSLLVWQPLIFLAVLVGGGLLFAGATDTCMMGMLLLRLPYNRGAACDVTDVLTQLQARSPLPASQRSLFL